MEEEERKIDEGASCGGSVHIYIYIDVCSRESFGNLLLLSSVHALTD